MFTGLIETVGEVVGCEPLAQGHPAREQHARLAIGAPVAEELRPGDSIAVNGVCLTVTSARAGILSADIGPETLRVTTLGRLEKGARVNLERPLRADGRFGGHFVQGHVDGIGRIERVDHQDEHCWITVSFPTALGSCLVPKGSIAVDGISLTVARLAGSSFDVQIVPFTLEHTNLRDVCAGRAVNLECDLIGKYVVNAVRQAQEA